MAWLAPFLTPLPPASHCSDAEGPRIPELFTAIASERIYEAIALNSSGTWGGGRVAMATGRGFTNGAVWPALGGQRWGWGGKVGNLH